MGIMVMVKFIAFLRLAESSNNKKNRPEKSVPFVI